MNKTLKLSLVAFAIIAGTLLLMAGAGTGPRYVGRFFGDGTGLSNSVDLVEGPNILITPGPGNRAYTIESTAAGAAGIFTNGIMGYGDEYRTNYVRISPSGVSLTGGGSFAGDGSGLTNIPKGAIVGLTNLSNLTITNGVRMTNVTTLGLTNYGNLGTYNLHLWDPTQTTWTRLFVDDFTFNFSGLSVSNAIFYGDGGGLTGLNGSQVTAGTVADARIASTIARDSEVTTATQNSTNAGNIAFLPADNVFTGTINHFDGSVEAAGFYGDGSGLTNVPGTTSLFTTNGGVLSFPGTNGIASYQVGPDSVAVGYGDNGGAPHNVLFADSSDTGTEVRDPFQTNAVLRLDTDGTISVTAGTFSAPTAANVGTLTATGAVSAASLSVSGESSYGSLVVTNPPALNLVNSTNWGGGYVTNADGTTTRFNGSSIWTTNVNNSNPAISDGAITYWTNYTVGGASKADIFGGRALTLDARDNVIFKRAGSQVAAIANASLAMSEGADITAARPDCDIGTAAAPFGSGRFTNLTTRVIGITNVVVFYETAPTFPTNAIPPSSASATNWAQLNYGGLVRFVATNYANADVGSFIKLVGETVSAFVP